ncbi:zf-HC2 domain-containing protein [Spiractinospora alimapuensis]|uniref:anti-sigma factor family protein n=1 Tax=Spiractinospora alimapuensis TaxID=2820884 RepID=UPI001F47D323|nr:zf-HC2 domain-containing protein [Spiractinospora alimapuensis]QVQ54048.1 zf-HC2 domain-containing protein [Spiractinospora alimapuensis]
MSHLGERISAFVDGELAASDRDRVLSHLASCESCRFEAEMLRRLKRRLCHLDTPGPSTDLVGRLSSLTGTGASDDDSPPPPSDSFGSRPPIGSSRPLGGWPGETPERERERDNRGGDGGTGRTFFDRLRGGRIAHSTRYGLAGACVAAVTLGTAFIADTDRPPTSAQRDVEEARTEAPAVTRSLDSVSSLSTAVRIASREAAP